MKTFAFLRAINVGGHTVKMDALRPAFCELDLSGVATFIASGNVIFDTPDRNPAELERALEEHLEQTFGFPVATFLRTTRQLAKVPKASSFTSEREAAGNTLSVGFKRPRASAKQRAAISKLSNKVDQLELKGRELYWLRTDAQRSKLTGAQLETALGCQVTLRNLNTVDRLLDKFG